MCECADFDNTSGPPINPPVEHEEFAHPHPDSYRGTFAHCLYLCGEMAEKTRKPSYFLSVLDNRCPRCRTGKIFQDSNPYHLKHCLTMNQVCPVCGQATEIEVGFYYGTGYVSYALTVGFSVFTFLTWWLIIGFSLDDNRVFWWIGVNAFLMIALQPVFMRLSRTLWLSWFVRYDRDWKKKQADVPERIIPGEMNNW